MIAYDDPLGLEESILSASLSVDAVKWKCCAVPPGVMVILFIGPLGGYLNKPWIYILFDQEEEAYAKHEQQDGFR